METFTLRSETSRFRHLVEGYCVGNGLDLGAAGDPVVPNAIQVELPLDAAKNYGGLLFGSAPIQLRGDATNLHWFADESLDFVYSSHLLEDFADWLKVLCEWVRVLRYGGHLVLLVPDHKRFRAAVAAGQGDNLSHRHEFSLGELPAVADSLGMEVVTECIPDADTYTILFVGRKTH